jgi:hypothetical protein
VGIVLLCHNIQKQVIKYWFQEKRYMCINNTINVPFLLRLISNNSSINPLADS